MSGRFFVTQKDNQVDWFEEKYFHTKAEALDELYKYFRSIGYLQQDIEYYVSKTFNIEYVKSKHYTEYLL